MASHPIYRFKAVLAGSPVGISREILIMDNAKASRLSYALLSAFLLDDGGSFFRIDIPYVENAKRLLLEEYGEEETKDIMGEDYDAIGDILRITFDPSEQDTEEIEVWNPLDLSVKEIAELPGDAFTMYYGDFAINVTLEDMFIDEKTHGREFPKIDKGEGYGVPAGIPDMATLRRLHDETLDRKGDLYDEIGKNLSLYTFDIGKVQKSLNRSMLRLKKKYES